MPWNQLKNRYYIAVRYCDVIPLYELFSSSSILCSSSIRDNEELSRTFAGECSTDHRMTSHRFINRRDLKVLDKVLQNVLHTDWNATDWRAKDFGNVCIRSFAHDCMSGLVRAFDELLSLEFWHDWLYYEIYSKTTEFILKRILAWKSAKGSLNGKSCLSALIGNLIQLEFPWILLSGVCHLDGCLFTA